MKVLLMVERDGRVVSVPGRIGFDPAEKPNYTYWLGGSGLYGNWKQRDAVDAYDRWWLVEAESAEAARAVVAAHVEYGGGVGEQSLGRILASGGRK